MKVSPQARKKNPALPEFWQVRAVAYAIAGSDKTVFTSLPATEFTAQQVATLYHERWEIELGFRGIKSSMQHYAMTLRSKKVACQCITSILAIMAGAISPSHTARRLSELRGCIGKLFVEKRPRPASPRALKISKTRYPVNRHAAPLK